MKTIAQIRIEVIACRKCPRLVEYREEVARTKRRAYRDWEYWGRPVPGFGDPRAGLVIIGLAPAAHGANRTGRMFSGDRSGDFLYKALHGVGFANQPTAQHRDDGLKLHNAYITAAARCCPPANQPLPEEINNCRGFLLAELDALRPRAVLALGRIGFDAYVKLLREQGAIPAEARFEFRHGTSYKLPGALPRLFAVYHPSQQNTQTGRVTSAMYARVLSKIVRFLQVARRF